MPRFLLVFLLLAIPLARAGAVPHLLTVPAGADTCPVAVIGHAYFTDAERYGWLAERLSAAGWIVAVPTTHMGWDADPDVFAAEMGELLAMIRAEHDRADSPLRGRVDPRAVVIGHSLGGAAAVRAAAAGGFDGLVTMAVLNGGPVPTAKLAPLVTVPTLMLAVAEDCVTPPAEHEFPVWERLGSPARLGVLWSEGVHCGFASADPECRLAEAGCGTPAADAAGQQAAAATVLLPWLDALLAGDPAGDQALAAALAGLEGAAIRGDAPVPAVKRSWGGVRAGYR